MTHDLDEEDIAYFLREAIDNALIPDLASVTTAPTWGSAGCFITAPHGRFLLTVVQIEE
jgi:hypothetical protein